MAWNRTRRGRPVALVAGASRGIGKAAALRLAREGWDLALVSRPRSSKALQGVAGRCRRSGARVLPLRADLAVPEKADFVASEVLWVFHRIDALVHCVGDYAESGLRRQSTEEWERLFLSNVHSAFYLARAALGPMRKQRRGRVVFFGMAGVSALRPRRSCAAYAAAKAALLSYARSLSLEEAPNGITVNVVSPGVIPHEGSHPSARRRSLLRSIPAGRPGRPEEVAAAVSFLLSPEASYITGSEIPISGGWML